MNITKKWTVFGLAAALAATMTLGAIAETPDQSTTSEVAVEETSEQAQENRITGTIMEIDLENGEALIFNEEMGEVLMRFENALLDGVPTLYPGVTVTFETTGIMTMSLPAQMNAVGVECVYLEGTVQGFEDGMLLVETETLGAVAAHLNLGPRVYGLENLAVGAKATVFFNGITTRSIPAQLTPDVLVFEAEEESGAEGDDITEADIAEADEPAQDGDAE